MTIYRLPLFATALSVACISSANAQDNFAKDAFVEANILSIFYHELGHAIIDLMEVPIFGQEEDAADVLSVLLMNWLFEEDAARALAHHSAFGFINDPEQTQEVQYWDLHGPDEQRYYNYVCIFYGANPDEREDLARELGLPEDRADWCPSEYDQAENAWGMIFDEMDDQTAGVPMVFITGDGEGADVANRMLEAEVRNMNADIKLPQEVTVKVETCDEANAFYDPREVSITFCTEFIAHLEDLHDKMDAN